MGVSSMLDLLHIENIAVIEEADITFHPGFNALTGETGAGKSIVIDAMGAVLGQRTSRELIRTGAAKAFVSAVFSAVPELPVLRECGLDAGEGELLLQREIYADGRNACRVNGRPVTVAQLRRLGAALLNIHGQHDGQQLLDEEQHESYLDSFGRVEGYLATYGDCYAAMEETRRKIRSLQMDEAEKARRMDSLQFQIGELERAELKAGEEEAPSGRRRRPWHPPGTSRRNWVVSTAAWRTSSPRPTTCRRPCGTWPTPWSSPPRSWTIWRAGWTSSTG